VASGIFFPVFRPITSLSFRVSPVLFWALLWLCWLAPPCLFFRGPVPLLFRLGPQLGRAPSLGLHEKVASYLSLLSFPCWSCVIRVSGPAVPFFYRISFSVFPDLPGACWFLLFSPPSVTFLSFCPPFFFNPRVPMARNRFRGTLSSPVCFVFVVCSFAQIIKVMRVFYLMFFVFFAFPAAQSSRLFPDFGVYCLDLFLG